MKYILTQRGQTPPDGDNNGEGLLLDTQNNKEETTLSTAYKYYARGTNNSLSSGQIAKIKVKPKAYTPTSTGESDPFGQLAPTNNPVNAVGSFGRKKVAFDFSKWRGVWSFQVSPDLWIEEIDGIESVGFTNCSSVDGKLTVTSNGATTYFRSKANLRYDPNRGFYWADSGFIQGATSSNGKLRAARRTYIAGAKPTPVINPDGSEIRVTGNIVEYLSIPIDLDAMGVVISNGNIRDMKMQWRGVGNQGFYINLETATFSDILGTLDELSISNPSMPVAYECTNQGICRFGLITSQNGQYFEWEFNSPTRYNNASWLCKS